jgi:hypothetical protein
MEKLRNGATWESALADVMHTKTIKEKTKALWDNTRAGLANAG